ncbi:transposase [Streptomyces sp. NPDC023838]|uniref:transposase n=1 Tax=Streptomyces sp. NPDC023838 TaxID=3154325 RepID=UPI0033CB62FD
MCSEVLLAITEYQELPYRIRHREALRHPGRTHLLWTRHLLRQRLHALPDPQRQEGRQPHSRPHAAPQGQCDPCPVRTSCTRGVAARTINFLPRQLHELQARNRAEKEDSAWRRLYVSRSGIEGTMSEFVHGHQARPCRYHGLTKTQVQHVLTALAVNIERLSLEGPDGRTRHPRPPTAFQHYLESHGLPRPLWWRQGKQFPRQDPRQSRSLHRRNGPRDR